MYHVWRGPRSFYLLSLLLVFSCRAPREGHRAPASKTFVRWRRPWIGEASNCDKLLQDALFHRLFGLFLSKANNIDVWRTLDCNATRRHPTTITDAVALDAFNHAWEKISHKICH